MERWQEHLPLSSASLLPAFDRATRRRVPFSPAERALFMACEFWSAVLARSLAAHSGSNAVDMLRYMHILYSAIGAQAVANEMVIAIGELADAPDPQAQRHCLGKLQENLLGTGDPVDQLIAGLAERLGLGSSSGLSWGHGSEKISRTA